MGPSGSRWRGRPGGSIASSAAACLARACTRPTRRNGSQGWRRRKYKRHWVGGGPEDILIAEPCVQSDGADPKRTNATSHLKSVKPWGPGTSPRGARPGAGTGRPGAPPPGTAPSPDLPPPHSQPWSPMTPRSPFAPPAKPSNSSRAGGGMGGAVIIRALVRRVFLLWRAPPSIAALPTRPPPTTPPPTPVFDRFAAHVAPAAKGRDLGGPPPPRPPPPRPRRRPRRTVGKT